MKNEVCIYFKNKFELLSKKEQNEFLNFLICQYGIYNTIYLFNQIEKKLEQYK